jgi:hypothetical protein
VTRTSENGQASVSGLLGSIVRVGDVRVGVVTALLSAGEGGVFGIEVSGHEGRWFLPSVSVDVDGRDVSAASPLHFGRRDQLDTYVPWGARVIRAQGSEHGS